MSLKLAIFLTITVAAGGLVFVFQERVDQEFHCVDAKRHLAIARRVPGQQEMIHTADARHRIEEAGRNAGSQYRGDHSVRVLADREITLDDMDDLRSSRFGRRLGGGTTMH